MRINVVAAMAEDRGIGINNRLPWHLPADLRYFQNLTTGKVLIMGRHTWDSLGRPLPRRHSIVLSQSSRAPATGEVSWADSWDEALALARGRGAEEVYVIGGARIYQQSLAHADRIYLTLVHTVVPADAWFPEL
ncbi:MAG TPA: dihydrofolate reductase, partial [Acidiferrobacteraceae bacterium]|nr:dihydrofolate reductase [Acidiferrobacteraceae bacterium]